MTAWLKKWWPAILPALLASYHSAYPQIQAWVSHHPSATVYIASFTVFGATLLKSPLVQEQIDNPVLPKSS
jgi:hypothetical protein